MHWNLTNDEEFGFFKFLNMKYRRGNQLTSAELIPNKKLGRSSLIWRNLKKLRKSTSESCKMHLNLMNDEEFVSFKFLKYRKGEQIIQSFFRIGFPKKLCPPYLIWGSFKMLRKVLLNYVECIEIWWMIHNLGPSNFEN